MKYSGVTKRTLADWASSGAAVSGVITFQMPPRITIGRKLV